MFSIRGCKLLGLVCALSWFNGNDASAQATFTDSRLPRKMAYVLSGDYATVGAYDSVEAAFAAYRAWYEGPAAGNYVRRAYDLHPCPDQGLPNWLLQYGYTWGYPMKWCHRYAVTLNGQPWSSGLDTVISVSETCAVGYGLVNAQALPGTGGYGNPYRFERRCERTTQQVFPKSCGIGNPIYPSTGQKRQREVDYQSASGQLRFVRTYDSNAGVFRSEFDVGFMVPKVGATGSCMTALSQNTGPHLSANYCHPQVNPSSTKAWLTHVSGSRQEFSWNGTAGQPLAPYFNDSLTATTVDGQPGYLLKRANEGDFLLISGSGQTVSVVQNAGAIVSLTYSTNLTPTSIAPGPGYLIEQADQFGRAIRFTYFTNGYLASMADPAGRSITYTYDEAGPDGDVPSARLGKPSSVVYQDLTKKVYVWDEAAWSTGTSPGVNRLTGVVDESENRFASFGYLNGAATSTERAGAVERFSVVDNRSNGAGTVSITGPTGSSLSQQYALVNGLSMLKSQSQPPGSGCAASSSSQDYDANGNVKWSNDFDQRRTCFAYNQIRNLEVARVEGLAETQLCDAVTGTNAVLPAGSRKLTTEWHPDWRIKTRVAEPNRRTTYIYNGQPDAFAGGALASCAPAAATLPDGKPIAVLCKQVEQATTDADGGQAFSATPRAGVPDRVRSWTYNEHGQVLTEKDSLNRTTTYEYHGATAFTGTAPDEVGVTKGDLKQVTNAAGHVTRYTKYNRDGQVLEMVDANGVTTTYTYNARQRLTGATVGGRTTTYTYTPTGLLERVTQPDGSYVQHEYDPAHRLRASSDNLGNRIDYVLDAAGNRTAESVKDATGALRRQLGRAFDALGRVQQTTGRE